MSTISMTRAIGTLVTASKVPEGYGQRQVRLRAARRPPRLPRIRCRQRSPPGAITGIDTSAATAEPGVLAVLTHENAPKLASADDPELAVL